MMRLTQALVAAIVISWRPCVCGGARAAGQNEDRCLTAECHRALADSLVQFRVRHAPLERGTCTPCHNTHGEIPPQRRSPREVEELCGSCHVDTGQEIRESRYRHTAIDRAGCVACHLPHGGDHVDLLKNVVYVSEWEAPLFVPHIDLARLCWQCHDQRLAYEKKAAGFTRFRDGDRNLHELHVGGGKGRTCKSCHDTHASDQPFHVRPDVPFGTGGWKLPVRYTKTEDGGSCEVGCHRPQTYRRTKPQAGVTGNGGGPAP